MELKRRQWRSFAGYLATIVVALLAACTSQEAEPRYCPTTYSCSGKTVLSVDTCTGSQTPLRTCGATEICSGGGCAFNPACSPTLGCASGNRAVMVNPCTGAESTLATCDATQLCSAGSCVANPACTWRLACASTTLAVSENPCTGQQIPLVACTLGDICQAGYCAPPPVNPHVGALLDFPNGPLGWIVARFPHADYTYTSPTTGSCTAEVIAPGAYVAQVKSELVMQVSVWGPSGSGVVVPPMDEETDYPYYLMLQPDNWPTETAAGQTFSFQIIGQGAVPSFTASIMAPEPVTGFAPQPRGGGLIDFSRANPPEFTWPAGTLAGQQFVLKISGGDLASVGSNRVLTCFPQDTGAFRPPASEMLKFYPSTVTVRASRSVAANISAGLSGGGVIRSETVYVPTDSQGSAIPQIFTIN